LSTAEAPPLGQFPFVWQLALLMLHLPSAGQLPAPVPVHAALLTLHFPLIAAQFAFVVQAVPVLTEQLPDAGHCVAWFGVWQVTPVLEHAPLMAAQLASLVQTVPVLTLQWPALPQAASLKQELPVTLQVPACVGQLASLVQVALVTEHLPAVVQVGGGQVLTLLHVPHSEPTHKLQPGGSYAVVHDESGGLTHVVWMLAQVCALTLLQLCDANPQVCVW
jgi:hypothetical protein